MFRSSPELLSVVLLINGEPDLLNRSAYYEMMTGKLGYGWALHSGRPVRRLLRGTLPAPRYHHTMTAADVGLDLLRRQDVQPSDDLLVTLPDGSAGTVPSLLALVAVSESYRVQAEQLTASERRFRALVHEGGDAIIVVDANHTIRYASPALNRITGRTIDDHVNESFSQLIVEPDRASFEATMGDLDRRSDHASAAEFRLRNADGTMRLCEATIRNLLADSAVGGIVLNVRDVTERRQLEEGIQNAHATGSVGQLTPGVAHEISAPIEYIGNNIAFLRQGIDELLRLTGPASEANGEVSNSEVSNSEIAYLRSEIPAALAETLEGIEQVSGIVRALKSFSNHADNFCTPMDLNTIIETAVTMATPEHKPVADVSLQLAPDPPVIMGYTREIGQVMLNLVVNACHAIADRQSHNGARGLISIESSPVDDGLRISISDDGGGIPDDILPHIFDPFFSTKSGGGTGHGLSTTRHVIVERHFGRVDVEVAEGHGTTFHLWLPAAPASATTSESTSTPTPASVPTPGTAEGPVPVEA